MDITNTGIVSQSEWVELMTELEHAGPRLHDLLWRRFADRKNDYDCDSRKDLEVLAPRDRALANVVLLAAYPDVTPPNGYVVPSGEVRRVRSLVPAAVARHFVRDAVEQLSAVDDAYARGADRGHERCEWLSVSMETDAELVMACEATVGRDFQRAENNRFAAHVGSNGSGCDSSQLYALGMRMQERAEGKQALTKAAKSGASSRRSEPSRAAVMAVLVVFVVVALIVATTT